eukprot:5364450-Pyramimonas_sp.AAC.1
MTMYYQEFCSLSGRCDVFPGILEDITGPKDVAGAKRIVESVLLNRCGSLPPGRPTHEFCQPKGGRQRLHRHSAPTLPTCITRQQNADFEPKSRRRTTSFYKTPNMACINETNWMLYWAGMQIDGKHGEPLSHGVVGDLADITSSKE